MPGRTIAVDRDTLKWARETSGLSPIQAAELLRVDVELLKELEEGNHLPNVTLFNHMVVVYRRSPAVLMLSPPPLPDRLPIDRRTIEGKQQPYSREIIFAVREAREFQEELADLVGAGPVLFQEGPVLKHVSSASSNPEPVASKIRELMHIYPNTQWHWKRDKAYAHWRLRVEQHLNVLVLDKKMPVSDCLGFSLVDNQNIPTVVMNKNDKILQRKTFTLFHEVGHLLLRRDGICLGIGGGGAIEKWCNDFAGAVLVAEESLRELNVTNFEPGKIRTWVIAEIETIADNLRVSRDVVAIRLQTLRVADDSLYETVRSSSWRYRQRGGGGIGTPADKVFNDIGSKGSSIVLTATNNQLISSMEASELLRLQPQWFRHLTDKVSRQQRELLPIV